MTTEAATMRVRGSALVRTGTALRHSARVVGRFLRGPRRVSIPGIAALACFVAAGFTLSALAGLLVAGVTLLIVDWRMTGGSE